MHEYVFGHVQRGGHPLAGQALADAIVEVAVALPGFAEWCRHQHEINKLALYWARSIEADPDYYPYSPKKRRARPAPEPANNIVPINQTRALDAEQRIQGAIATLQAANKLPAGTTARADAIVAIARCSKQTLQKHRHLWHPESTEMCVPALAEPIAATVDDIIVSLPESPEPLLEAPVHTSSPNKLLPHPAAPSGQADRHNKGSGAFSTGQASTVSSSITEQDFCAAPGDCTHTSLSLSQTNSPLCSSAAMITAALITQAKTEQQRQRQVANVAKMQAWLESGDPILVPEAQKYFAARSVKQSVNLPTDAKRESG